MKSPTQERNTSDPGDATQRNYRYQYGNCHTVRPRSRQNAARFKPLCRHCSNTPRQWSWRCATVIVSAIVPASDLDGEQHHATRPIRVQLSLTQAPPSDGVDMTLTDGGIQTSTVGTSLAP